MKNNGVFIITGASQGLGSVIAAHAHQAGFPVALIGRSKAKLAAVEKKLRADSKSGPKITSHAVDLTNEKAVRAAFEDIQAAHGATRALVNNAGTWTGGKSVKQLSRSDMQASLDLNFFSAFNATKALLGLKKRTPEVSIVNIGALRHCRAGKTSLHFVSQRTHCECFRKVPRASSDPKESMSPISL